MGILDEYVKSTGVEYKETEINDIDILPRLKNMGFLAQT